MINKPGANDKNPARDHDTAAHGVDQPTRGPADQTRRRTEPKRETPRKPRPEAEEQATRNRPAGKHRRAEATNAKRGSPTGDHSSGQSEPKPKREENATARVLGRASTPKTPRPSGGRASPETPGNAKRRRTTTPTEAKGAPKTREADPRQNKRREEQSSPPGIF